MGLLGVKGMYHSDLRHEQARQTIDAEQVHEAHNSARVEHGLRYAGSMSWKQVDGHTYLYRKVKGSNCSLGPESEATRAIHAAFHSGRDCIRHRLSGLVAGLVNDRLPHLRFDAHDLSALPAVMCRSIETSMTTAPKVGNIAAAGLEPDW